MENPFFERPIINSPYEYPSQHWELDEEGQPTEEIIKSRRGADFITPIPKPKQLGKKAQQQFGFEEGMGLSTQEQQYEVTAAITEIRRLFPGQSEAHRGISSEANIPPTGFGPMISALRGRWPRLLNECALSGLISILIQRPNSSESHNPPHLATFPVTILPALLEDSSCGGN